MKLRRALFSLFAALCLLGAQQAAFAHWAAHLGAPARATLESPDGEHALAAALGQSCAGCSAFAALDAAPSPAGAMPAAAAAADSRAAFAAPVACAATKRHFDSRAPPRFL